MLDVRNIIIDNTTVSGSTGGNTGEVSYVASSEGLGKYHRLKKLKGLLDIKCAAYLRLCATKNAINRAVDYHYLVMAVTDSTEPRNDIDYIHPVVKPVIDYSSAVITKGLCPNGQIDFEFVPDTEEDTEAARQATKMVSSVLNEMNDPHKILREWIMDAAMHKNGMMMVLPVREKSVMYREIQGTTDQLRAFERQAEDSGLKAVRQSRRKLRVDIERVMAEMMAHAKGAMGQQRMDQVQGQIDTIQSQMAELDDEEAGITPEAPETMVMPETNTEMTDAADEQQAQLNDAINRNTIYKAKYKLTGYSINVKLRHVPQHYWICDPNVQHIQEQPFCGFYDPMTIQQALELYPDIDLEEFRRHADYNQNGAFQAGSVLNNLAIHGRDSVPTMGIPVDAGASADPDARHITILTCWDRYDIDGDGELELVEIIVSGSYIISAKEVEFIPIANMNPKPLPGNFFGMSIGESVIPMQEYATACHRAEILLGLLTATPRIGVKPDRVDFEQLMDGEAAIFILDSKFNPQTDVWPIPPPSGNLQFVDNAMARIQQDTMNMVGMTQPSDTFNPEVMAPGNSGAKLQLAMGPNQLIQDDTVKNAGEGLKEAIWLVWRTLVQYGDDYGVKKLAQKSHPNGIAEFLDFKSFDDLNFCERKQIEVSLALGMMSEENQLQRYQIIKGAQTELYQKVSLMVDSGTLTPAMYKKIKKPYEDTLYSLKIKDADSYLPSDEEVVEMIKQGAAAAKAKEPSPAEKKDLSAAELNVAKANQLEAQISGADAESKLDYMSMALGKPKVYS